MAHISILVTLDQNYLPQLQVMLTSLKVNNPKEIFCVYLLHRGIPAAELEKLECCLDQWNWQLVPIVVDGALFAQAPVTKQYPQEMYYRLLASSILPQSLDKVLYLDPDLLVINPLRPLWETDMGDHLFAAAAHTGKTELANNVNRLRLGMENKYFNSGVLLINLSACRREIHPNELFQYVQAHSRELLLPDQDVLNILYGSQTLELDDFLWNYDARNFSSYYLRSSGMASVDWVMANTAILHFCGKEKPWKPHYRHRFGVLYRHYMQLSSRFFAAEVPDPEARGHQ